MTPEPGSPSRRALLRGAGLVLGTSAVTLAGARLAGLWHRLPPFLLSEGVAVGPDGVLRALPVGSRLVYEPGTRVPTADSDPATMPDSGRRALVDAARSRRSGAILPDGPWRDLADGALDDLLALTSPVLAQDGAPAVEYPAGSVIAGPVGIWRYTWPRDAAFTAVALAAAGLEEEALTVLERLASLLGQDGAFQARYTADGGVPDARSPQTDGTGWFLWAAGRVLPGPVGTRRTPPAPSAHLRAALTRAAARLLALTDGDDRLPASSPDYWEVEEDRLTLGTAAPVLLGLEAASRLAAARVLVGSVGREGLSGRCREVRTAVEDAFEPGWGRHAGGDDVDAAICWVLPPFTEPLAGALEARGTLLTRLARGSGGLAPGSSWRDDGVSWTPETALVGWSARALSLESEEEQLRDWLAASRTAVGALPEKVAATGAPAGPAPLAWTCALVVLAACG